MDRHWTNLADVVARLGPNWHHADLDKPMRNDPRDADSPTAQDLIFHFAKDFDFYDFIKFRMTKIKREKMKLD